MRLNLIRFLHTALARSEHKKVLITKKLQFWDNHVSSVAYLDFFFIKFLFESMLFKICLVHIPAESLF